MRKSSIVGSWLKPSTTSQSWSTTEPWIRLGNIIVVGLIGGLLLWSTLVSVSGAVVANGVVNVEHNNKTVQHLDGGIVAKILVKNGDRVAEGDVVLRLDETAARANHAVTVGKLNDLLVQQSRLESERDRSEAMRLPPALNEATVDADLKRIITSQRALFEARRTSRLGEQGVLRQRLSQAQDEVRSLEALNAARRKEQDIAVRELKGLQPLFDKGYVNQGRVGPVQREVARLEGEVGRLTSEAAKSRSALLETELKLAQSDKEFTQNVVDELRKVQAGVAELTETRVALEDKLKRTSVRAPRAGRVHALAVHTEGGVIQAASPIMQIVPEGERLIIDAQIQTVDVDKVRKGQAGTVRFPAFNAQTTPRLDVRVINISAAQVTDQQGRSFFTVQVELPPEQLRRISKRHELLPGMPAEVYIETGERSILSYFVKPLVDVVARAFREQ